MKLKTTLIAGAILAGLAGTSAMGDGHANKAAMAAVKARQAAMQPGRSNCLD